MCQRVEVRCSPDRTFLEPFYGRFEQDHRINRLISCHLLFGIKLRFVKQNYLVANLPANFWLG